VPKLGDVIKVPKVSIIGIVRSNLQKSVDFRSKHLDTLADTSKRFSVTITCNYPRHDFRPIEPFPNRPD